MCDDVVLRLKKLCKSMHVNVIKAAISGWKNYWFLVNSKFCYQNAERIFNYYSCSRQNLIKLSFWGSQVVISRIGFHNVFGKGKSAVSKKMYGTSMFEPGSGCGCGKFKSFVCIFDHKTALTAYVCDNKIVVTMNQRAIKTILNVLL